MRAGIVAALCAMMAGLTGCITGGKQFTYVVGPSTNEVFQFRMQANGQLAALSPGNFPGGAGPVSVLFHPSGLFAYVVDASGNAVTLLAVNRGNGQLSVPVNTNPIPPPTPANVFNTGTTPIAQAMSPSGAFLYIANQGSGNINIFTVDSSTGNLATANGSPVQITPGNVPASHPSAMAISPDGKLLFVCDPTLGTVSEFSIASSGTLAAVSGSPFSMGAGATPVFVTVDASSRFLYVSDPAHNAVLGFAIQSSALAPISGSPFTAGSQPAGMTAAPQGALLFVANHGSNNVSAFVIDHNTGALAPVSGSPFTSGGQGPSDVAATSTFVYVTDQTTNDVSAFSIGANGTLTAVPGSPFTVATSPISITVVNQ